MEYIDLELALRRRDREGYALELRLSRPSDAVDLLLARDKVEAVRFNQEQLLASSQDSEEYGKALTAALFADPEVRRVFLQARDNAQSAGAALRVRLFIETSALDLHSYRWELLRDPQTDQPLFTGQQIYFSRYLSSSDWRPVRTRARKDLQILTTIASPYGLEEYQAMGVRLGPINIEEEQVRVREQLQGLSLTFLASPAKATLNNMVSQLLKGKDILYLLCHGVISQGETWLFLEAEDGSIDRVSGNDLVVRLNELSHRPTLVILAACQTAGSGALSQGNEEAFVALGPRLAEAGIPAVLAMDGNVSVETASRFLTALFQEIQQDGQIDRAVAIARGMVRDRADAWMPVLFMRLKTGRIWYSPAFAADDHGDATDKWPAILTSISDEECTPIIGPDLSEPLFGRRSDIAWRLANENQFPMDPHDREGLPQVTQFLSVNLGRRHVFSQVTRYLYQGILDRHDTLPSYLNTIDFDTISRKQLLSLLDELITIAWRQRRDRIEVEPHQALAKENFSIYLTTDYSSLLETALREENKTPIIKLCPWRDAIAANSKLCSLDEEPTPERPLVYHLFGNLQVPDSLVLTEDDFFDYLIGITRNSRLIPPVVLERLVGSSLLLLGFQVNDWYFRSLFRFLMNLKGREYLRDFRHFSVQVSPEEDRILEPRRARKYLEEYIRSDQTPISIFWGSAEDFTRELRRRRQGGGE